MAQDRDQDHAGCKQPEAPLVCANNCGFFGCPATMNLCSKCYRELRLKEESQVSVKAFGDKNPIMLSALVEKTLSKGALSACTPTTDGPQGDLVSVSSIKSSTDPLSSKSVAPSASGADIFRPAEPIDGAVKTQQDSLVTFTQSIPVVAQQVQSSGSTRCVSCRKRVGLLGFKCRCGSVFCSAHRYSDKHGCSFDYKAAGRDAIAKANPVVKAEKVEKI